MKNIFTDYDFAIEYMLHDDGTSRRMTPSHDLDYLLRTFNYFVINIDLPHYELRTELKRYADGTPIIPWDDPDYIHLCSPDSNMIDIMDIVFTRAGDDISWTSLISWSRKRGGFSILPELSPDIMPEVLNAIIYEFWEKVYR